MNLKKARKVYRKFWRKESKERNVIIISKIIKINFKTFFEIE